MSYNERVAAIIDPANVVGLISKIYGAAGQVVVRMWDNFPQDILDGDFAEPLWVEIDSIATPLFVASIDRQGSAKAVVVFDDFGNENISAMIVGKKIYAEFVDPEDDAVSAHGGTHADWSFLEGYAFLDTTSGLKGEVVEFIANSLNPLLNVRLEVGGEVGGEVLVPIAEPLIEKISRRSRTITMQLATGFFFSE